MTAADLKTLAQLPKVIAVLRKAAGEAEELARLAQILNLFPPASQAGQTQLGGASPAATVAQPALVTPPIAQPEPAELRSLPMGVRRDVGGDWGGGVASALPAPPVADPDEIAARKRKRLEDQAAFLALARASRPPPEPAVNGEPHLPNLSQKLNTVSGT